ncbi:TfuA-like protein [Streptomyces thermoalcalitolerans]|uniref:TfuA-like core domain-containing protein n=1 Tax=Streptomyces thermoalcalitolerans TaxID=65605 RepID=A0ABN1NI52_9ACTN
MIHVFVGPTLPRSEPLLAAPDVRAWPPVQHGDLFDSSIRAGDTVVILDGVYHQAPALRHKEILAAMGRGVAVIGAASIGALRAAELAPFGMLGVGGIFAAYMRGEIDGDDEVAVGQSPDGEWDALSWPLVTLRHVLGLAQTAGLLDGERAAGLLADLQAVYYPQRTTSAVRAVCRRRGEEGFAGWLAEQRERDPYFGDLKRADALAAVRTALRGWAPRAEARPAPGTWESPYFRQWSNVFASQRVDGVQLFTEDRLLYQQVFNPQFPRTWMAYLAHRSLHPPGGGRGLPLEERLAQVTGGGLAAHQVFHPPVDLRDETTVSLLLADETRKDRQAVARYADALALTRRSRPGFSVAAVRGDLARRMLLRAWGCSERRLDEEASARGLVCAARAVQAAKRLVPGYLKEGRGEG